MAIGCSGENGSIGHKVEYVLEYVPCDLCAGDQSELLFEIQGWKVVRCMRCGLAYVNPRPPLGAITKMYQESADTDVDWASSYVDFYRKRFSRDVDTFGEYLGRIKRHKTSGLFLDVGCGTGASLYAARSEGFEVRGVEIGHWAQEWARNYDLDIVDGTLEEAAFPDRHFDVVFSKSFLEHTMHPRVTLREMHRILKDDGLFVCAGIPNLNCFTIKLGVEQFRGNAPPAHLYYFEPRTLVRMITRAGFRCESVSTWGLPNDCFSSLLGVRLVSRQADKLIDSASERSGRCSATKRTYAWARSVVNAALGRLGIGAVVDVYAWKA